jgi:MurNAc alpha-1-phosphate uridylyltransferase
MDILPGEGLVAVHNADVLCNVDVQQLAGLCPVAGCAIGLVPNPPHHAAGDFSLHGGLVVDSGELRFTFSGVSVWQAEVFSSYAAGEVFSLVRPMRQLIGASRCAGLLYRGPWFDIGRPVDLMRARRCWGG